MAIKNIPVGYKDSPLGIIPQEWEVKRLGEVCKNKGDYGINAPAVEYSETLPTYLRITDIDDSGRCCFNNKVSVNNMESCNYLLYEGDIVFARTGATVGKSYLYNLSDGILVFAGFLIRFSINTQKLIPYFLKSYVETNQYWNWVKITSQRSGQPGINAIEYCSLNLPLPPLAEQEKIAEILTTWDKAIEKQTQLIQKLELRKKGLMQQLLTGKKRLLGFYKPYQKTKLEEANKKIGEEENNKVKINNSPFIPQGYKSTILGIIPEEWEVKKLGEILAIGNGKDYNSLESGDIPVFGTGGIICYVDDYLYCGDTVCIGRKGTIDKPIYYSGKIWTVDTLFYTYGYKATTAKYLYLLFQIINWKKYNEATGVPSLSKSTIERIMIPLPPLSEQQKIAEVLIAADREIEILQNKSEQLRQQKLGLMQQLLTGKKRVKY